MLRTLRLDRSDTFVFAQAAEPGEWASAGGFQFWAGDPATLQGQERAAFRSGFLGLGSFGWSTLVEVGAATPAQIEDVIGLLAQRLLEHHAAPDLPAARAAAREEIAFAMSLADHPLGTVIALQRTIEPDGSVRERYRTIKTTLEPGANAFAQGCVQPIGIAHDDDEGAPKLEEVDFVGLMKGRS